VWAVAVRGAVADTSEATRCPVVPWWVSEVWVEEGSGLLDREGGVAAWLETACEEPSPFAVGMLSAY